MPGVRLLDAATIGRIAAGEVVERPSAAIKELIENSLDAGATAITVEIREGGLGLFRVTDNGAGMAERDAVMAFTRHATSKIASGNPLCDISTLGFRGEALPSIAAVSDVTLKTRAKGAAEGIEVKVSGSAIKSVKPCGCPEGTSVEARDIFANAPARLKFLKKPSIEAGYVADVVAAMMLSFAAVSFRLLSDGKLVYHTGGDGDTRGVLSSIYGREAAQGVKAVSGREAFALVTGFVGVAELARANRSAQHIFVNRRHVKSPLIVSALEAACREWVLTSRFPLAALYIDVPAAQVDVNVHPNKLEVRFADEQSVRRAVYEVVSAALTPTMVEVAPPPIQPPEPPPPPIASENIAVERILVPARTDTQRARQTVSIMPERVAAEPPAQVSAQLPAQVSAQLPAQQARIIGQTLNTYVLLEHEGRLLLMDQHAAHERVLFERFKLLAEKNAASQPMLTPLVVDLLPTEKAQVLEQRDELAAIGFEIDDFGGGSIKIRALPHILGQTQARAFFLDMLSRLSELRGAKNADLKREALVRMACRAAVKGGDALSEAEMRQLVLKAGEAPPTCPHGRPIYIALTRAELERRFGRTQ